MNLLQRLAGGLLAVLFLIAVLVFASLTLGVLLAVGLVAWGWLWWRSRPLRRDGGRIIEGQYRDETPRPPLEDRQRRRL
jgi:hypothetical protein